MNGAMNSEKPVVAYCRICGKALTEDTQRLHQGTIYCEEHAPAIPAAAAPPPYGDSPYTAPGPTVPVSAVTTGSSPGLAFLLGLIPGVGAVYNGQYAKGLIHVLIFGLLISIMASDAAHGLEPLFAMVGALFYFYMAFEAYHTAKKRQLGQPVDEFSSIVPVRPARTGFPIGPVVLIALGVLFLLNTMNVIRFYEILRYWPVFLILMGAYMLYARMTEAPVEPRQEVEHERR